MYIEALKILYPALRKQKKLISLVISGLLSMIALSVGFSYWRGYFYDNIQQYQVHNIWLGIYIFIGLALVNVVVYGMTSYFTRFLEFGIREFLYDKYSKVIQDVDVPSKDQRLCEDTLRFAKTIIALIKAVIDASVRLPVFLFILWSVASPWMVLVVLVYAVFGTLGSKWVASKLVILEYSQEAKEARLRRAAIKSIEEHTEMPSLDEIRENWVLLAVRNKYLSYYTSFYSQLSVIIPFVMLLPLFLNHVILLGVLFQTAAAIEQVLGSLSVFVDSRDLVVDLQMVTTRLKELDKK